MMRTPEIRNPASSWGLLAILLFASVSLLPKEAHGFDACDSVLEDGEPPGPLFGLDYSMMAHALAEKACAAPPSGMTTRFLQYVEKKGCGPETAIYAELKASLAKLEAADLETLASDGDPAVQLSPNDVQNWTAAVVAEWGGCKLLIDFHALELP